jgi:hypothetical protein
MDGQVFSKVWSGVKSMTDFFKSIFSIKRILRGKIARLTSLLTGFSDARLSKLPNGFYCLTLPLSGSLIDALTC